MSMRARLVTTEHGQYESAEFDGQNRSGIAPFEAMVVVLPDAAKEKVGNLYMPNETRKATAQGAITGIVVAVGPDVSPKGPAVGDHVIYHRYTGQLIMGLDSKNYRIMNNNTIAGKILADEGKRP